MASLADTASSPNDFIQRFAAQAREQRLPLTGMVEITSRCNLRCVHCYLGPQEEQHKKRAAEMSTDEVKALIDQMIEAGTLYLTITGGDPMMRPDFPDIYRYAKRRGLLVDVFCDGVLVTDRMVQLFKELPPSGVEISIYGATAETYERVTRVPGSFPKFVAGVERLVAAGITLAFKTVLMTLNKHEFGAMEAMAKRWGGSFRYDSAVFPCLSDSNGAPMNLRVDPEEVVALELADPERLRRHSEYFEKVDNLPARPELYQCGAGLTSFYVSPFGEVSPCLMTTRYRYGIRESEGGFGALWRNDVGKLRRLRPQNPDHGCNSCSVRAACGGCSAMFALETGHEDVKSDYVCRTTQLRVEALRAETERRNGRTFLRML